MQKSRIDHAVTWSFGASDRLYLESLNEWVPKAIEDHQPNLIIYNAGTDCLDGDPLGRMNISQDGIVSRDEIVFKNAIQYDIPIVMVLSGGYQMSNAQVIARSIENLKQKGYLRVQS